MQRNRFCFSTKAAIAVAGLLTAGLIPQSAVSQTAKAPAKPAVKAAAKAPAKAAAAKAPAYAADSPRVLLIPQRETTLVAQEIAQVREIKSGLGTAFKKGQTLIRFDCGRSVARRDIARASVSSAKQNLAAKKRLQALKAAGGIEVDLAQAEVEKASAELQLTNVQIGQCRIRAPYDGRIVRQHVRQYQGVKAGDPLLEVVATGRLKLRLNVPSRWLAWLKPGAKFEIQIDETGKRYQAAVKALNARVDAASQSIEIEGEVTGKHPDLLAGMSGVARFARN